MKSYYMPTIDGRPAEFDGTQIVFMNVYGKPNEVCRSLKEIRRQQKQSIKWRSNFGVDPTLGKYGYFRVRLPVI